MKKVKKLVIYRRETWDRPVYGCPECNEEVDCHDSFCRDCGTEFEEDK